MRGGCFGSEQNTKSCILTSSIIIIINHYHQSLNREGRWGTTDDFANQFSPFSLFSTALWDLANSRLDRT